MSYSERRPENNESEPFVRRTVEFQPIVTGTQNIIEGRDKPVMLRPGVFWIPPGWIPPCKRKKIKDIVPSLSPGVFWIPPGWIPPDEQEKKEDEKEKPASIIVIDENKLMAGQIHTIKKELSVKLEEGGYLCLLSSADEGYLWMPNAASSI